MKKISLLLLLVMCLSIVGCAKKEEDKGKFTYTVTKVTDSNGDTNDSGKLVINKNDITDKASFITYKVGNKEAKIIAVKASDGSIRTTFNACQVCYDSGKGYFKQKGDQFQCQNCGNIFNTDVLEIEAGGCNPTPIGTDHKVETEDTIEIDTEFIEENIFLF